MDAAINAGRPAAQPPIIRKPARKSPWKGLLAGMVSGALGAALAVGGIRLLGEEVTGVANKAALRAAFGAWAPLAIVLTAVAAGYLGILAHEVGT